MDSYFAAFNTNLPVFYYFPKKIVRIFVSEIMLRRSLNSTKRNAKKSTWNLISSYFIFMRRVSAFKTWVPNHRKFLEFKVCQIRRCPPAEIIKTRTRKISRVRWLTKAIDYSDVTDGACRQRKGIKCLWQESRTIFGLANERFTLGCNPLRKEFQWK